MSAREPNLREAKDRDRGGQIVTFYSYKGGTGRSMALANVGWILASTGRRVLLIDWDLEAPGLHRYFHPFLEDAEASATPGLIDFFVAFASAAREEAVADTADSWFEPYASLIPYTMPVRWDHFGSGGALELVSAGRQDAAYGIRVSSFDWQHFYAHGGGVFLEAVKRQLRHDYDYILIDSRTGISDTSGICTVQMPDQLMALFTLNRQSINGAAAIADSADRQRRHADGRPSLTIWPVPTRIELAEKERLEAAREAAKAAFDRFLAHMPLEQRIDHWNRIEVIYQPYYAYEEVLGAFGDSRRTPGSMLSSMEAIASLIVRPKTISLPTMPETRRKETLAKFERRRGTSPGDTPGRQKQVVFISYERDSKSMVDDVVAQLTAAGIDTWMDSVSIKLGEDWSRAHAAALKSCSAMLYFVGPDDRPSEWRDHEVSQALAADKLVVPVLIGGSRYSALPLMLRTRQAAIVKGSSDVITLADGLRSALAARASVSAPAVDPEDPQKGRWGGESRRSGRQLRASGRELSKGWFEIELVVEPSSGAPLDAPVQFHLHPTFARPVMVVDPVDGRAVLTMTTYGAFTVGAVADDGRTTLELDLSEVPELPEAFRNYR